MAEAKIRVDQPTHSTTPNGAAGRARDDIEISKQISLKNDNNTDVKSFRWSIISQPVAGEGGDDLSDPTAAEPTFTPTQLGSYLIQLIVNQGNVGEVDRTLAVIRDVRGFRIPAFEEVLEANWDDPVTGKANEKGWWLDYSDLMESIRGVDSRGGPFVTGSATSGGGVVDFDLTMPSVAPVVAFLRVVANGNTVSTDFRFYADVARTDLVYEALAKDAFTSAFVDGNPFAGFSVNNLEASKLHGRFTNNGANDSTYNVEIVARG